MDFSSPSETATERQVIAENFLNPLLSAHEVGKVDASFVAKIADVLLYKIRQSAYITNDIHAAMKRVLNARLYDALMKDHPRDRKRKVEEIDAGEQSEDEPLARRQRYLAGQCP